MEKIRAFFQNQATFFNFQFSALLLHHNRLMQGNSRYGELYNINISELESS